MIGPGGRFRVPAARVVLAALASVAVMLVSACGAEAVPALRLEPALDGATFEQPVEVGAYPDGRTFVAERGGRVWLVGDDGGRTSLLDLSTRLDAERGEGLLSVALDPAFASNRHVWAYYFAVGEPPRTVLSRLTVPDGEAGDEVDLASELMVMEFDQPGFNQNGGAIRFDEEGHLYLSLGDGSASSDPFDQGQDRSTLLATVIRIDVRDATVETPYRVPDDNPFLDEPGTRPEIYAYGLRNPFRMSIDEESGEIWLGDVGVSAAEEINRIEAGGNYGWSIVEGDRCLDEPDCATEGLEPPVHSYAHDEGRCSAIGGVVYRGEAVPALRGRYLFGDLCSGEVWALGQGASEAPSLVADLDGMLVTFGFDAAGEVLVADHAGGGVYRLVTAD